MKQGHLNVSSATAIVALTTESHSVASGQVACTVWTHWTEGKLILAGMEWNGMRVYHTMQNSTHKKVHIVHFWNFPLNIFRPQLTTGN
jgi:hypothetical protein